MVDLSCQMLPVSDVTSVMEILLSKQTLTMISVVKHDRQKHNNNSKDV